jgi:hypothetical protein
LFINSEIFLVFKVEKNSSCPLLLSSSLDVIQITLWKSLVHYRLCLSSTWFTIHSACAHSQVPHFGRHCIVSIRKFDLEIEFDLVQCHWAASFYQSSHHCNFVGSNWLD